MQITKSKLQQIVQKELQRLIYEQSYARQGAEATRRGKQKREMDDDEWMAGYIDKLTKEGGTPQEYDERQKRVAQLSPELQNIRKEMRAGRLDRAALEKLLPDKEARSQFMNDLSADVAYEVGTELAMESDPSWADVKAAAKKRGIEGAHKVLGYSYDPKKGAISAPGGLGRGGAHIDTPDDGAFIHGDRPATKEELGLAAEEDRPFGSLESQEAWLDKEMAQQAALGAPGSGTGLGGQPAGTPSGIAPPTFGGKAATAGQTAAMSRKEKEGGSIGGGLSMKSMVPSAKELAPGAWDVAGKSAKLADKIGLGSDRRLVKASGKKYTPEQSAALDRALGERRLRTLNKLEQIVKEAVRDTNYNKNGAKHS